MTQPNKSLLWDKYVSSTGRAAGRIKLQRVDGQWQSFFKHVGGEWETVEPLTEEVVRMFLEDAEHDFRPE